MNYITLSVCGVVVLAAMVECVFAGTGAGSKSTPIVKVKSTNDRPSAWNRMQNKARSVFSLERPHFSDYIRGNGSPEY